MDQPTTSVPKGDNKIKPENIGSMTTKTLERMIWKLKLDQTSYTPSFPLSDPVTRTARYTGMNKINVDKLLAFGDTLKFEHVQIDRLAIQRGLTNMYLVKNKIPTITEFFHCIEDVLPAFVDLDYFIKILIQLGYVFYKFPGRKVLRVMEKKSVMFERYRYLKSIDRYRKDKVPISYVGVVSVNKQYNVLNLERTLQSEPKNILTYILFTASADDIYNVEVVPPSSFEVLQAFIKQWLSVIFTSQNLPAKSVCILEDSKIFRETLIDVPTWKSVKADMVEWLEEHNIPFHKDMSKADLLQLIDTCTDTNENKYVIDNLAKCHNYVIMTLPQCINGLSIIPFIIRCLNDKQNINYSGNVDFEKIFQKISTMDLKCFTNTIEFEERIELDNDIKIDNKLDELVRSLKMLDEVDNEDDTTLFTYSDSE